MRLKLIKYEFDLGPDDAVEVRLDRQANVRMLDGQNFERFRRGEPHDYYGGWATASPVVLRPPQAGYWYVVVDLGGYAGTVSVTACVI